MERMAGKTAHSWALIGGLSAWAALQPVVGCNGTTTQDTGNPVADSPIVVQLLGSVGPDIVVPTLERFAGEASALSASLEALEAAGGAMIVTADHGNVEMMTDAATGQAHTAHTMNKVPVFVVGEVVHVQGLRDGRLADIAPTLLDLLGLAQPVEMTGQSLIVRYGEARAAE